MENGQNDPPREGTRHEGAGHDAGRKAKRQLPAMAFDPIAAALRQLHEQTVSEEIPDDFMRLLDQLDSLQQDVDKQEQRKR